MVDDGDDSSVDICRVCRTEASSDRPLHYPCMCTGSIKYVHQECLTQWLKYSRKEYCELCHHKYTFMPIYHPDMPKRLPLAELAYGMVKNLAQAFRCWFHYTLVAIAWLGVVPLTACRIYRCLFQGTINSLLTLPLDMLSMDNLFVDCVQGGFIVGLTLCAFVSLVWLREQILHGGPPQWLNLDLGGGGGANNANANANANAQRPEGANNGGNDPAAAAAQAQAPAQAQQREVGGGGGGDNQAGEQADAHQDADQNDPPPNDGAPEEAAGAGGGAPAPALAAAENGQQQQQQQQENQDDPNWQPFEWDRAAEELTWERLFGLDGSLIFLEHVFWVISLNTLFILVFAFSPYYVGHFAAFVLQILSYVRATYFEGLALSLFGYVIVGAALFLMHQFCRVLRLRKAHRILGMCYLVVKVFLLVLVEIGVFPLICGWWLDVCSLRLFNASIRDRVQSFQTSPTTSMFFHWLVGMVYVFYFASFVLLLREVLRPGVLWFLRNLNDPEFNPIQEMIQFPVYRHVRRSVASLVMFGVTVLLLVHYPIRIILFLWPTVLPYNIHLNVETPLSELSLELLLLQVILPALLEQGHARHALKVFAKWWCFGVGRLLGLTEYLLPTEELLRRDRNHNLVNPIPDINHNDVHPGVALALVANNNQEGAPAPAQPAAAPVPGGGAGPGAVGPDHIGNLRAEHQALLLGRGPSRFQPYHKPSWLPLRIFGLLVCVSGTLLTASLVCLSLPVSVGRYVIWILTGREQTHELYTMACGLYVCWVVLRLSFILADYLPRGWSTVLTAVKFWAVVIVKCVLVCAALLGVIPLLLGTLFQLMVVAPLRTTIDQSPVYFPWQDWAMGILLSKIVCALIVIGPDWRLKRVLDQIYQDGVRNMHVGYIIYREAVLPACTLFGLAIAVPYVVAHTVLPIYGITLEEEVRFQRHIYPCLLLIVTVFGFLIWQFRQLRNLLTRIRNERYLVGQRLVNYERQTNEAQSAQNI